MKKILFIISVLWASLAAAQPKLLGESGRRLGAISGNGVTLDSIASNSTYRVNKDSAVSKAILSVINQNSDTVFTIRIPKLSYGGRSFGIGYRALTSLSSGDYPAGGYPYGNGNVAVGDFAAWKLLEGNENTAIGGGALFSLTGTAGADPNVVAALNTAIGSNTLYHLDIGGRNVAIGQKAGYSTTNGVENVYIGKSAASNAINDTANTIIGGADGDFTGKYNTIIGNDAGRDNIANYTTGLGASTLYRNTQDYITAIGYQAGVQQTSGLRNIYIGAFSGASVSTNGDGIFIGYRAGDIATGANNLIIGSQSGRDITTGANNLVIGTTVNSLGATVSNGMVIKNAIFGTGLNGFSSTVPTGGKVGIFVTSPSARLHLAAGTATANTAPLKISSGTNLTSPESGAIEYDGIHFYGTVGSSRRVLEEDSTIYSTKAYRQKGIDSLAAFFSQNSYTPTLSNAGNAASYSVNSAFWTRQGAYVTVYINLSITATSAAATAVDIELPISSNLTSSSDATGSGSFTTTVTGGAGAVIVKGISVSDVAQLQYIADDTSAKEVSISFRYIIK